MYIYMLYVYILYIYILSICLQKLSICIYTSFFKFHIHCLYSVYIQFHIDCIYRYRHVYVDRTKTCLYSVYMTYRQFQLTCLYSTYFIQTKKRLYHIDIQTADPAHMNPFGSCFHKLPPGIKHFGILFSRAEKSAFQVHIFLMMFFYYTFNSVTKLVFLTEQGMEIA